MVLCMRTSFGKSDSCRLAAAKFWSAFAMPSGTVIREIKKAKLELINVLYYEKIGTLSPVIRIVIR